MSVLFNSVIPLVIAALLACGGLTHLRHPLVFREIISVQVRSGRAFAAVLAAGVTFAELTTGFAVLVVALGSGIGPVPTRLPLTAATGLAGLFAIHLTVLYRRRPGLPCGCSGASHEINTWSIGRAFVLLALGAIATATQPLVTHQPEQLVIASLAAVALADVLWELPAAMHDPMTSRQVRSLVEVRRP